MPNRSKIEESIRGHKCPSCIAEELDISVAVVIEQVWVFVGMGVLRLTDVYFSFRSAQIQVLKAAVTSINNGSEMDTAALDEVNLVIEEVELFKILATKQVIGNELYEYISEIETAIHQLITSVLVNEYGEGEEGWWRFGIPLGIRQKCQARREEDDDPTERAFAYTDLIDLSEIITKNWDVFKNHLAQKYGDNRKRLLSDFVILNKIRKGVMHPVKQKQWTESDYKFVCDFRENFWKLDEQAAV